MALVVVAGAVFTPVAAAATGLTVSVSPTQPGTSASPTPVTATLNTTVDNDGASPVPVPVARSATIVQTLPAELTSRLASFGTCATSNYSGEETPPGGADDPTVSCPANAIVGGGSLKIAAVGFGDPIPASSDKVVLVKSGAGTLAFWVSFEALGSRISRILPGTVSSGATGQTVIAWDPTPVQSSPALRVWQFNTIFSNAFASSGCAAGSWAFSVVNSFVGGSPASQTANATVDCSGSGTPAPDPPIGGQPVSTSAPTISGGPQVGEKLTANDGTWTGGPTLTRQWTSCDAEGTSCSDIAGATASSYTLQASDAERTVRVVVTATNTAGTTTATSGPTAIRRKPTATAVIGVGSGPSGGSTLPGPGPAVACASPAMTARLIDRPVRTTKGRVPVLRSGARYLFQGRLTCLRAGRRVAAPNDTVIQIRLNRGKSLRVLSGTTTRRGTFRVILRFYRATSVTFRYVAADRSRVQAKLRLATAKRTARP